MPTSVSGTNILWLTDKKKTVWLTYQTSGFLQAKAKAVCHQENLRPIGERPQPAGTCLSDVSIKIFCKVLVHNSFCSVKVYKTAFILKHDLWGDLNVYSPGAVVTYRTRPSTYLLTTNVSVRNKTYFNFFFT